MLIIVYGAYTTLLVHFVLNLMSGTSFFIVLHIYLEISFSNFLGTLLFPVALFFFNGVMSPTSCKS